MSRIFAPILCLLLATTAFAQAQGPLAVPAGAPPVGNDRYTVHATGTLQGVLKTLAGITGRQMWYNVEGGAEDRSQAQVTLDFEDTPLEQILLSVCRQAGVVHEAMPGGGFGAGALTFRTGDLNLDARPAVDVGEYILRVVGVGMNTNRQLVFRWGEEVPAPARVSRGLFVTLQVAAKSPEAGRLLAGMSPTFVAQPDKGEPLEAGKGMAVGYYQPFGDLGGDRLTRITQVNLPYPPEEATKLTRLSGTLMLFSGVKVTELKIPPNSEGQTFTEDDVSATVQSWKPEQGMLVVNLLAQAPPLPKDPNRPGPGWGSEWQTAALVMKDGKQMRSSSSSYGGGGKGTNLSLRFPLTQQPTPGGPGAGGPAPGTVSEIDHLHLTFFRGGNVDKTVPFVIENIPLPGE